MFERSVWALLTVGWLGPLTGLAQAQSDANEAREAQAVERLATVLDKNPRRGTTLDRVYGYHVEHGTVDRLAQIYRDRTGRDRNDGAAAMLLGLVESHRGRDAVAVAAFRQAESARPGDPLASYYLGQSLLLVGQPDAAEQAFERALERKPARADLLEIFQALGRLHQRAQRPDRALAIWTRLERLMPDDLRVRELVAAALADEGQPAEALARYEALAKQVRDPVRRVQCGVDAADMKVRLGRKKEAVADLDGLLARVKPESWLYREILRRIEEVFYRSDDEAGLAVYYEGRIKAAADDFEAMSRLGRVLASLGRSVEARRWLEQAIKSAPTRRDLRLALIDQLERDDAIAAAADEYRKLAEREGYNPDTFRAWGRLLLKDQSRPEADRKAAAAAVWRQMADAKNDDPLTAAQVADLLAQAGKSDDALEFYHRAIALAPTAPQFREYLAAYLNDLGRTPEALDALRPIASGQARTAPNLRRFAEACASLGALEPAIASAVEACRLEPRDLDLRLMTAELFQRGRKYCESLAQLDVAAALAESDDEALRVLTSQLKSYHALGSLVAETDRLRAELDSGKDATPARWVRLGRLLIAGRQFGEAVRAGRRAIGFEPQSIPGAAVVAEALALAGDLGGAADAYRALARIDRRDRTEHLTELARLEAQLGHIDRAVAAGRELMAAAPGAPTSAEFFANLCFELGEADAGIDALRRSMRASGGDIATILTLAEALAKLYRTDEAIEIFWRAFAKSPDQGGRLRIVARLAELYIVRNQFEGLPARLRSELRDADKERDLAFCLAVANEAVGDFGAARHELEALIEANPRDLDLLDQLTGLAEREGDAGAAARYQQQVVELKPTPQANHRLAQLYVEAGETARAEAVWERLTAAQNDLTPAIKTLDSLLRHQHPEIAAELSERLLRSHPDSWELLYRSGLARARQRRFAESERQFRALLNLRYNDGKKSAALFTPPGISRLSGAANAYYQRMQGMMKTPPLERLSSTARTVQYAMGLGESAGLSSLVQGWGPADFGQARMAALGGLMAAAHHDHRDEAFQKAVRDAAARTPADPRALSELLMVERLRDDMIATYRAARDLARTAPADPDALCYLLDAVGTRFGDSRTAAVRRTSADDTRPPLPGDEIELLLASYRTLRQIKPEWIRGSMLLAIDSELKTAGRTAARRDLLREAIDHALDAPSLGGALELAAENGDVDAVLSLFDRADTVPGVEFHITYGFRNGLACALGRAMNARAFAGAHADILRIYDHYLTVYRARDDVVRERRRQSGYSSVLGTAERLIVWVDDQYPLVSVAFPPSTGAFDLGSIQLLRNAYELLKRDGKLDDLRAHLRAQTAAQTEQDRFYGHIGLACVHAWENQRDDAAREMERVVESRPDDAGLLMAQGELLRSQGKSVQALAAIDSFKPADQKTMQRREFLALELAVRNGSVARARQAAERLFALRLEIGTQIQVAGMMQQLGMPEMAEAILARARRRAGGELRTLFTLMEETLRQKQTEASVQIAREILRKTAASGLVADAASDDSYYHQQALQTLARAGHLKETIARLEGQVKSAPTSLPLLQTLATYYIAAAERDKLRDVTGKIARLRPDDARIRYQIATQLAGASDYASSLEHFRAALKADPSLISAGFTQLVMAFERSGRVDELVDLLDRIDLRAVDRPGRIVDIATALSNDPRKRDLAMRLRRKLWQSFPSYRVTMLADANDDPFWNEPKVLDDLYELYLPGPSHLLTSAWDPFETRLVRTDEGAVVSSFSRVISLAARQGRLDDLSRRIDAALRSQPAWRGGVAARAVVDARLNRVGEARAALQQILDDVIHPRPAIVSQTIGEEVAAAGSMDDLSLAFWKDALKAPEATAARIRFDVSYHRGLERAYRRAGRNAEARGVLEQWRQLPERPLNHSLVDLYNFSGDLMVADEYRALGYPADGVRVLERLMGDRMFVDAADPFYQTLARAVANTVVSVDDLVQRIRDARRAASVPLDPDSAMRSLRAWIGGSDRAPAAIDLALVAAPRELDRIALRSLWLEVARLVPPGERPAFRAELDGIGPSGRSALSADIARALCSAAWDDAAALERHVRALARRFEDVAGASGGDENRRAALSLWVAAREARSRGVARDAATALEARALEAARGLDDSRWLLAMLREQGLAAQARGDGEAARRAWTGMIEHVLPAGRSDGTRGATASTVTQFDQAAEIARLAVANGEPALALSVLRSALDGGPPLQPVALDTASSIRVRQTTSQTSADHVARFVAERLFELIPRIAHAGAGADTLERTLRAIVMPESRPGEILLLPAPLSTDGDARPRSAGALLVHWTVLADRVGDLEQAVTARRGKPMADVAADVLIINLDLQTRRFDRAAARIKSLSGRLGPAAGPTAAELACHALVPALAERETAPAALAAAEAAAQGLARSADGGALAALGLASARSAYAAGLPAVARQWVDRTIEVSTRSAGAVTGELAVARRRQDLARVVRESLRAGALGDSLLALGLLADLPMPAPGDLALGDVMASLGRQLAAEPAPARYERLRTWTFPAPGRRSVRLVAALVSDELARPAPVTFVPTADPFAGVLSTAGWLIAAARETDKLDELAETLRAAAEQKVEGADLLRVLVDLARGRSATFEAELRGRADALAPAQPAGGDKPRAVDWPDVLLARACLADRGLVAFGERALARLLAQARATHQDRLAAHLERDLAARFDPTPPARGSGGVHAWLSSSATTARGRAEGGVSARWSAADGAIVHEAGDGPDLLLYTVPLTGTFEIDVDASGATGAQGHVGYGGWTFAPTAAGPPVPRRNLGVFRSATTLPPTWPHGPSKVAWWGSGEAVEQVCPSVRAEGVNRYTIQVAPGRIRGLVNDQLFFEDTEAESTAPWLGLAASAGRRATFRSVVLRGEPTVPRQVELTGGERLAGWNSTFYGEAQPMRLIGSSAEHERRPESFFDATAAPRPAEVCDWWTRGGEIIGRRNEPAATFNAGQSRLVYVRPLAAGESLRYEFFYEPGRVMVHPSVGRRVLMLEPTGARLHWATDGPDREWSGLEPGNLTDDPSVRRGPALQPLRPKAWNGVTLRIREEGVGVELNGQLIVELGLEPGNDRRFGLFHDPDQTSVRVRGVVLSGPWPERVGPDLLKNATSR